MTTPVYFEKSIAELETIVKQLEKGELSLDESLKQFEHGINLARTCQTVLNEAEQKIKMLTAAEIDVAINSNE
ncbi:MAG: exodeoxyribonuclease VII small subunit [Legionella sp.]